MNSHPLHSVDVSDDELREFIVKLCEFGDAIGIESHKFTIMLGMAAKYISDIQGIHVRGEEVITKGIRH